MSDSFCRLQGKDPRAGIYSAVNTFPGYNDLAKLLLSAALVSYKENDIYLLTVWRLPGRENAWRSSARSGLQGPVKLGYVQSKKNSVVTSSRVLPCLANFELLRLSL